MNENLDIDPGEEPGKDNAMIDEHQKNSRRRDSDGEDCPDSRQAGNEETDRQSREHRTQASVTQGGGHYKQPELSTPEELMSSLVHPVTVEGLGQLLEGEMVSDA
ncbi:uncharacterized protein [Penaeus vannamei]|uniref:uncharacterized protein isoform X2 n=1 Tax=Penaeus vannamei TaxID=6689 RepID=UPI00387F6600